MKSDIYYLESEIERLNKVLKAKEREIERLQYLSARFVSRTYDLCKAVGMSERDTVVWFNNYHSLMN